jgi:uncharacterized protein DUF4209
MEMAGEQQASTKTAGAASERYPADLVVTRKDFDDCGWKDVLTDTDREGYSSMWQAFSGSAKLAMGNGRIAQGKVLWLLAEACSMMLTPSSTQEPYRPYIVIDGKRSVIPDDLTESDISFFALIVDVADYPFLKARLADLVWLRQQPRDVQFALAAIDAYRLVPLDTETFLHGGRECWERALRLTLLLGDGAGERLNDMVKSILEAFKSASVDDRYLALWLSELLDDNRLGRSQARLIAEHLEALARGFDTAGDLHRTRDYLNAAANWFKTASEDAKSAEMTAAVAESWAREAVARISSDDPSHMVAASFYENAIQTYRTIPRSERAAHNVDERIAELRNHLNAAGEKSLDELSTYQSPGIDISEIIHNARQAVRGKDAVEALRAFANVYHEVDADDLRSKAIVNIQKHPLQHLFDATMYSRDGRVIAKRPSMNMVSPSTDGDETVIISEMLRTYSILVGIVVQGNILPAHDVLLQEHRFREGDFIAMASQSPIVPKDRAQLFGKALFSGYDQDYVAAIHLLTPQIENMVRVHLKISRITTTNLDKNGIENENGLSALMESPESDNVFGKNLAFEIRALFCDAMGPNLRNALAHGLLSADGCESVYAVYAWWLGLRIVFNTYWNTTRKKAANDDTERAT